MSTQVATPSVPQEIIGMVQNSVEMADVYVIDTQEMADLAGEDLKALARLKKQTEDARLSITRPLDAAKKAAMDVYRPLIERIEAADSILRRKLNAYLTEQDRIRREAEAEAERSRRAELAKLEQEQAAARAAAEAAIEANDEVALDAAMEKAAEIEDKALETECAPTNIAKAEKVSGINQAVTYVAGEIDLAALVAAAAANPDLLVYLSPNTTEINRVVKALRERANIPGVSVKREVGLRVRK